MDQEDVIDTQRSEASGSGEGLSAGGLGATRGINLGGLLGGLLGGQQSTDAGEEMFGGAGFGGLLSAFLGAGETPGLAGLLSETGLSHSALQAIVPLILGALVGQPQGAAAEDAGATRAALVDLAQDKAGAADVLSGTGLLQEIMKRTGLNKAGALGVIMAVLKALGVGKTPATTSKPKPKPKPKPSAKPKPKPKPSASAASKPKPKPKPSSHATTSKPKPKPKPASHTTSSKPKPKPKPKRAGEVGEETGSE